MMDLVVVFSIGDEYTFSADDAVPVRAESKETFLRDFELAMAAYEPDNGVDHFSICGQVFSYQHFIDWTEKQITPRRVERSYDATPPVVFTVEEWLQHRLRDSSRTKEQYKVNVVDPSGTVTLIAPPLPTSYFR